MDAAAQGIDRAAYEIKNTLGYFLVDAVKVDNRGLAPFQKIDKRLYVLGRTRLIDDYAAVCAPLRRRRLRKI